MMVGVLQEARIHLHLPPQNGLELLRHLLPRRDFLVARSQFTVRGNNAELLLPREGLFAQLVPAGVELALVLVGPFLRYMVRRMGRAGGKVDEERFVGGKRLLLCDPGGRLVGHIFHEVVALFGRSLVLDRRRAVVEGRVPLVRLATHEAVEILKTTAARRPGVERAHWARLPDRDLVALAELRCGVAVEL